MQVVHLKYRVVDMLGRAGLIASEMGRVRALGGLKKKPLTLSQIVRHTKIHVPYIQLVPF